MNKSADRNNINIIRPDAKTLKGITGAAFLQASDNELLADYVASLCPESGESGESGTTPSCQPSETQPQDAKFTVTRMKDGQSGVKQIINIDLGADSCFLSNPAPCMYCAFGLVDGDPKYLCRRDVSSNDGRCVECALAKKRCTWVGFNPDPGQYVDLLASRKAACLLLHKDGRSAKTLAVLDAMIKLAKLYLVEMWNQAALWEIFNVDCLHGDPDSTEGKKKKKKKSKSKAPRKEAITDKDAGTEEASSGDASLRIPPTPWAKRLSSTFSGPK